MPSSALIYHAAALYAGGWGSYKNSVNSYFGKNQSDCYATVFQFSTPGFYGDSTTLTVAVPAVIGYAGGPSSVTCRLSVTRTDPVGNAAYTGTALGEDPGRIISQDITFSGLTGGLKLFSFDLPAVLQGNTMYYLVLSASGTKNQFGQVYHANEFTGFVTYGEPASTPGLSLETAVLGTPVTIYTNRMNSEYTHRIAYRFEDGEEEQEIASGVGDSVEWTPPVSLAACIPDAVSGVWTVICQTYRAGTLVGSKTAVITLVVPGEVKPTAALNASLVDLSGSGWGVWIQGFCKARLTTAAAGAYGSTVRKCTLTGGLSGSEAVTGLLTAPGTHTWTATVTDSRGRTCTAEASVQVQVYSPPALSEVACWRCDSTDTKTDGGTSLYAKAAARISSLGGRNSGALSVAYCSAASGAQIGTEALESGIGKICFRGLLNEKASYLVMFTLTDGLGNKAEFQQTVSASEVAFHIKDGGKGAAFGKYAEENGILDVAWGLRAQGTATLRQGATVHAARSGAGQAGYIQAAEIAITAAYADQPIGISYAQRGGPPHKLTLLFTNNGTPTGAEIASFTDQSMAEQSAYLYKAAPGEYRLYIRKAGTYDDIAITEVNIGGYMANKISVKWTDAFAAALPSGALAAVGISPQGQPGPGMYAEAWTVTLDNRGSGSHTFTNPPALVIVSAQRGGSGAMVTDIWTAATSGVESKMYGYSGDKLDTWGTTVTVSGKTVTVARGGTDSIKYYVTAITKEPG